MTYTLRAIERVGDQGSYNGYGQSVWDPAMTTDQKHTQIQAVMDVCPTVGSGTNMVNDKGGSWTRFDRKIELWVGGKHLTDLIVCEDLAAAYSSDKGRMYYPTEFYSRIDRIVNDHRAGKDLTNLKAVYIRADEISGRIRKYYPDLPKQLKI